MAGLPVGADGHVETIVQFDPLEGELSEGVAVDNRGNVFVSLSPLGELVKVPAGTTEAVPFGQIDGLQDGDIGLIGLATDAVGNVYGGVFSPNGGQTGVWKFDRTTGEEELVPGTDAIALPNSVAFDPRGNMYVTDTITGAVWLVPRGGVAEPWIIDPLLAGDGSAGFGFPIGANGIAIGRNTVYVGVTESGLIVTVPIKPDGSAGDASVHAQVAAAVDGIALDVRGNVYIANPLPSSVLRVAPDGSVETLATDADGLDGPTSVAFGTGRGAKQSVYVANFSIALGTPLGAGPSLMLIDVGIPGLPAN